MKRCAVWSVVCCSGGDHALVDEEPLEAEQPADLFDAMLATLGLEDAGNLEIVDSATRARVGKIYTIWEGKSLQAKCRNPAHRSCSMMLNAR